MTQVDIKCQLERTSWWLAGAAREQDRLIKVRDQLILKALKEGVSGAEIGRLTGLTRSRVGQIARLRAL